MKHDPKVSIIIPFYNPSLSFEECVLSVLDQDYRNIEIILVNDGSQTDVVSNLCLDGRVKLVNQVHQGVGEARNKGLNEATGEYVCFLDADDYFEKRLISQLVKSAERNKSDLVSCAFYFYDHQQKKDTQIRYFPKKLPHVLDKEKYKKSLFQILTPNVWDKLFRLSFLKKNNLRFESLSTCNDFSFTYTAVAQAKVISLVKQPLVHYRIKQLDNISSRRGNYASNILVAVQTLHDNLLMSGLLKCYSYTFNLRSAQSVIHELRNCSYSQKIKFFSVFPKKLFKVLVFIPVVFISHIYNNITTFFKLSRYL